MLLLMIMMAVMIMMMMIKLLLTRSLYEFKLLKTTESFRKLETLHFKVNERNEMSFAFRSE
jgi:hypothetical protein